MENHEWNNKILKNVRNKIVVSNLEREENMKINQRKQVVSVLTATLIVLSGGFLTVNAATDGKLVEDIKQKYEELKQCGSDQKTKEAELEKNRKILQWIEGNKKEIDEILDI